MYLKRSDASIERIAAGTPMGDVLRRFWLPALRMRDISDAPTAAIYTQLLGEELFLNRNLAEPAFEERVNGRSYPVVVHDGIVWTFLGQLDFVPTPPDLGGAVVPLERTATRRRIERNWIHALEDLIDAPTPFLPPFYTSAFACVPASETETWIWSYENRRVPDRFGDGVTDMRRLMIRLARLNARGHFPMAALQGEWHHVAPPSS
jgi:hypothetical protein